MTATEPRPMSTRRRSAIPDVPVVFDTRVVTGSGGGPDKTILNSPRFLEPLGYKMLCGYLTPPNDPGYAEIERKAAKYGAPLISIPDTGPLDWRVVKRLLAECRKHNVTIWHGHDYKTNALGLLLKRFHSMRLVTTVHGWVQHTSRTPLYYRVDKFCLPKYEKVFCVSDDLFQESRKVGVPEKRCILLENAIDTVEYTRSLAVDQAKAKLGLSDDAFLVGGVGRLSGEKAFDVLIRSIKDLRDKGINARLIIVGEGGDRARLEGIVRELHLGEFVKLPGWQSDVRTYFEAMDVFALSSVREGLPNVLLEAMALEVPCVATRINGIPRLIQDGRNGFLVNPGDQAGLTAALHGVLTNADLRQVFRSAARRTIETRYSFPARMEKLKVIYDEILASAK
jgi:glycosyltransferase involved in cell wall biosynthesis